MMIAAWIARIMLCFCFGGPHFLHAQSFCRSLWHDTSFECKCASVQQSVSQWNALKFRFFLFFFCWQRAWHKFARTTKKTWKEKFLSKKGRILNKKTEWNCCVCENCRPIDQRWNHGFFSRLRTWSSLRTPYLMQQLVCICAMPVCQQDTKTHWECILM